MRPHTQIVPADSLAIYRVGGGYQAPSAALPMGWAAECKDTCNLSRVEPGKDFPAGSVLAVSHAAVEGDVTKTNVAGFVHVQRLGHAQGKAATANTAVEVTYLAPRPGDLQGKLLLAGHYQVFLDE